MQIQDPASRQSILADQFFYFFLRLRKERIRKVVDAVNAAYPDESSEQKARRLIDAQTPLSFLGGSLMHLPRLVPGLGQAFELLGLVGGASALTRMHLYLILEIALLYGKDIDDEARVPEMLAVVAATGVAAGVSLVAGAANTLLPIPVGGITASVAARMTGEQAIRLYSSPEAQSQKLEAST
ncbi:MAG TPA: hypothetical protein VEF34_13080 [Syntrophobacteraceae bacterium]|nr:hypothetical protein [Syntrophobacteraceae bacterium]